VGCRYMDISICIYRSVCILHIYIYVNMCVCFAHLAVCRRKRLFRFDGSLGVGCRYMDISICIYRSVCILHIYIYVHMCVCFAHLAECRRKRLFRFDGSLGVPRTHVLEGRHEHLQIKKRFSSDPGLNVRHLRKPGQN